MLLNWQWLMADQCHHHRISGVSSILHRNSLRFLGCRYFWPSPHLGRGRSTDILRTDSWFGSLRHDFRSLGQDNANFFWMIRITGWDWDGDTSCHAESVWCSNALRLSYDATNYNTFSTAAMGRSI